MKWLTFAGLVFLAACNSNKSPGADREAQVDPAPTPAPQMGAAEALKGIAVEAVQPETMTDADIASLGGLAGRCTVRLTSVGLPSFLFGGGNGTIKLNGKLITLQATSEDRFADGGLTILLRPVEGEGNTGLPETEILIGLPGAKDELGFRGYRQCPGDAGGKT